MSNRMNHNTGMLLTCLFEILMGILLLIDPIGFTSSIIIIFGIVLLIGGIVSVLKYFRKDSEKILQETGLAKGLLMAVSGVFCVLKSEWFIVTFPLLTVLYGVLALVSGICKVQWGVNMFRARKKYWFFEVIGAAITIICAILILMNPFASTAVLWTFIGLTMICEAVVDVVALILNHNQNAEELYN